MRGDSYLEYPLIINLIEDSPVDLVWFKGYPVEDRHTELCLDRFLDLNSYTGHIQVNTAFLSICDHSTHTYSHTCAGEKLERYLGFVTQMDVASMVARSYVGLISKNIHTLFFPTTVKPLSLWQASEAKGYTCTYGEDPLPGPVANYFKSLKLFVATWAD